MNSAVIEILAPRYSIAWYPWAVQYFFMVALAYAALWLAVPGLLFGWRGWQPVARTSLLVASISAIVAPIALLADLHQPLRFWHFYAYVSLWSWMSLGALLLPLFVGSILVLAWLVWREPMRVHRQRRDWQGRLARLYTLYDGPSSKRLIRLFITAALLFSCGIMLYTGMEVAIVIGRPLWNTLWLPPFFVGTGFVGAIGVVLFVHCCVARQDILSIRNMVFCLLGAMVFVVLFAFGWGGEGLFFPDSTVAKAIADIRHNSEWRSMAVWGTAVGGILILLGSGMALGFLSLRLSWVLGGVAVHFAWMCRWIVLIEVQTVQKQTSGFSEYTVGWSSEGWLGVIGTFGLWIALLLLVDLCVAWRPLETKAFPQGAIRHG